MNELSSFWIFEQVKRVYGIKAAYYLEVLEAFNKKGIEYVVLNLYIADNNPGDIDILFYPKIDAQYKCVLQELGFDFYTQYETAQYLWNKYVPNIGFIQVHCYEKFAFGRNNFLPHDIDLSSEVKTPFFNFYVFLIESFYKGKLRMESFAAYNQEINDEAFYQYAKCQANKGYHLCIDMIKAYSAGRLSSYPNSFTSKIQRAAIRLKRLFKKKEDISVLFLGVDGSGKTTLIEEVFNLYSKGGYFPKKIYLGVRNSRFNSNKDDVSSEDSKNITPNKHIVALKQRLRVFKGIFYWLEYNYLYIKSVLLRVYSAKTIFLIDRCYLDILRFYPSPIIRKLFLKYSLLPSRIVFLTGDRDILYNRKKEMSKVLFDDIYDFYHEIIRKLGSKQNRGILVVDTTEHTVSECKFIICNKLR